VIAKIAVIDASPLIIFQRVGRLTILRDLFHPIVVPAAVAQEVSPGLGQLPTWIDERLILENPVVPRKIDRGERAAIALAMQIGADSIVLDDLPARRVATDLGLTVIGSLGLLVSAKQGGLIPAARPTMDAMIASGLYVSRRLYLEILEAAGEADS
jgi:uncharacterized protein